MKKFLTLMMAVVVLFFSRPNNVVNAAENEYGTLIDVAISIKSHPKATFLKIYSNIFSFQSSYRKKD